jgi:hypothetical protein
MSLRSLIHTCIIAAICAVAAAVPVRAQDVSVSAAVNTNVVALDGQVVLEVAVTGASTDIGTPALPALPNFTVYSAGRTQNMSFVNGKFSSSLAFRYALIPKSTGKFTIPPIVVRHSGTTYQTQPLNVEVIAAGSAPAAAPAQPQTAPGRGSRSIFVAASVDKPHAYVNEQVTYSFRFYQSVRLLSNPQYVPANFAGFWTEDTPPRNYYATVDGQKYRVTEVKTLLFPTRPGTFNLGTASLQCSVEDFSAGDPFADDFFRSFFSGGTTQVLRTAPVTVTVAPLPATGKPQSFGGAVGQFQIAAALDRPVTKVNEPVTLSVTVSGTGNLKTLSMPPLPDWPDFRKYETVSSLNIATDGGTVKGSKIFKTVLVPQTPGTKTLPAIAFSFFDPDRRTYQTATTRPLTLMVAPGAAGPAPRAAAGQGPAAVTIVNRDIRYIKDLPRWREAFRPLLHTGWFLAVNALPPLALAIVFGYTRRQRRLSTDIAYARRLKASATAKKYLKHAGTLCNGAPSEFYGAVARALLEYIAHKANVSAEGLTGPAIAAILAARNVSQPTIAAVKTVLDECDRIRFAPPGAAPDMPQMLETAAGLINRLEKELH